VSSTELLVPTRLFPEYSNDSINPESAGYVTMGKTAGVKCGTIFFHVSFLSVPITNREFNISIRFASIADSKILR